MTRTFVVGRCVVLLAALVRVHGAGNQVVVEENDPRIVYNPWAVAWDRFTNPISIMNVNYPNYFHGGSYVAIHTVGGSASFTFNGSYIAYYGDLMNNHGMMKVTLDGKDQAPISTFSATPQPQTKIFEADVDPDVPNHTITITCLDTKNMGLDYFLYAEATPAIVTSSPTSTSSETSSTSSYSSSTSGPSSVATTASQSGQSSASQATPPTSSLSNNKPVIATAVVAGIGWALAIILAALVFHLRRRQPSASFPESEKVPEGMGTVTAYTVEPGSAISAPYAATSPPISRGGSSKDTRGFGPGGSSDVAKAAIYSPPAYAG